MDAIRAQGAMAGGWLAVKRICRCHPWGHCGHDPVPQKELKIQNLEFGITPEHPR
jgi:putative component of membrane protein insertase Oxa1/YidC/SpoIIIJ protein YidD